MYFKVALLVGASLTLSACVATSGDTHNHNFYGLCDPSTVECKQLNLQQSCTNTANSYPYSRDRLLYEEYGKLFTQDAVFQMAEQPEILGRDAIVAALRERGAQSKTRHLNSVVEMHATSPTTAEGLSYVSVFVEKGTEQSIEKMWLLGEYKDKFKLVNGNCLISKRVVNIVSKSNIPN